MKNEIQLPIWFQSKWRSLMIETMAEPKQVLRASDLAVWSESKTLENGVEYVGAFQARDHDRLTLVVRDMLYSMGAMHYYAEVKFPSIHWKQPGTNVYTLCAGLDRYLPSVDITAPLSASEKRRDPERYYNWRAGDHYPGFLTPKEAYAAALRWIADYTEGFRVELEADEDYKLEVQPKP